MSDYEQLRNALFDLRAGYLSRRGFMQRALAIGITTLLPSTCSG